MLPRTRSKYVSIGKSNFLLVLRRRLAWHNCFFWFILFASLLLQWRALQRMSTRLHGLTMCTFPNSQYCQWKSSFCRHNYFTLIINDSLHYSKSIKVKRNWFIWNILCWFFVNLALHFLQLGTIHPFSVFFALMTKPCKDVRLSWGLSLSTACTNYNWIVYQRVFTVC